MRQDIRRSKDLSQLPGADTFMRDDRRILGSWGSWISSSFFVLLYFVEKKCLSFPRDILACGKFSYDDWSLGESFYVNVRQTGVQPCAKFLQINSIFMHDVIFKLLTLSYHFKPRAARYSKINLDIVVSCLNIQDNNWYNIYIYSFRYNTKIVVSIM